MASRARTTKTRSTASRPSRGESSPRALSTNQDGAETPGGTDEKPFVQVSRADTVAWERFFLSDEPRPYIGLVEDNSERLRLVAMPLHKRLSEVFPVVMEKRGSRLFIGWLRLATLLVQVHRQDPTLALSLVIPFLGASVDQLASSFSVISTAYAGEARSDSRLKKQYTTTSGSRPHVFVQMCDPSTLRTQEDRRRTIREACIDEFVDECIVEAEQLYEFLIRESATYRRNGDLESVSQELPASELPTTDLVVLQVKDLRRRIGQILDEVEAGRRYVVRSKKTPLAVMRRSDGPPLEAQLSITRAEFELGSSGYLSRACQGIRIAISRAVAGAPTVILEAPPAELLRPPTADERRKYERERKRAQRAAKQANAPEKRESSEETAAKLAAVAAMTLDEVVEARRLWEQHRAAKSGGRRRPK